MKFKEGQKVEDTWYPEAGIGIVEEVLKTRVKVFFERLRHVQCSLSRASKDGLVTYDSGHFKFLK